MGGEGAVRIGLNKREGYREGKGVRQRRRDLVMGEEVHVGCAQQETQALPASLPPSLHITLVFSGSSTQLLLGHPL